MVKKWRKRYEEGCPKPAAEEDESRVASTLSPVSRNWAG